MAHLKKVYHQMQMGQTPFSFSLEGTTYLGKSTNYPTKVLQMRGDYLGFFEKHHF